MKTATDPIFHEHLDKCERCEQNPFDLCPLGQILIQAAGKEAMDDLLDKEREKMRKAINEFADYSDPFPQDFIP